MTSQTHIEIVRRNFPAMLLPLPVWLLWKSIESKKIPFYADGKPRSGVLDSLQDRSRLVDFDTAAKTFQQGGFAGVGVALGDVPGEELHLSGIDLDNLGPDPERDSRILEILAAADSYCEKSPSGNGLHILGLGDIGTTKNT